MKQKKHNRFLAALLAVAMMFQMLPMLAFADEGTGSEGAPSDVTLMSTDGSKSYSNLQEAVKAAESGDTIELGVGDYTLYNVKSEGMTKGKNLTFVGKGTDKTVWHIGEDVADPNKTGEYNGDYGFDGAGTVTFENMTLRSGTTTDPNVKLGFIRPGKTVVEKCEIVGWTAYWGDNSAEFTNTTFKPSLFKDAIWVYSSKEATFNNCTFTAGRGVKVYTEKNKSVTVNFNDCTVEDSGSYPAIYIDELVLKQDGGKQRYNINITGSNNVTAQTNTYTCSKLFGFKPRENMHPGDFTNVKIDGELVWSEGKMLTHDYTDGEKEQNFKRDEGDWTDKGDHYEREVTKTCRYCGYTTPPITEKGYKLEYNLNGGDPAEGADDETYKEKIVPENEKVELAPAPTMPGYFFHYWDGAEGNFYGDSATIKMTANTKLTAQWGEEPPEVPDTPEGPGCCGEVTAVIIAAGTTVVGYYAGTELLRNCYGLPYWPRNRSELALMLWEDADRPMPESTLLYPDIGQEEKDMDLQHAARWAMENELIPDLNWDDSRTEEEMKFYPTYAVSRARALHAWQKAQQLKQDA